MGRKSRIVMLPPCGHGWEMMDAKRRQQELLMQLRALVLPMFHGVIDGTSVDGTSAAEIAVQLFDDVIGCNIGVVSTLEWRNDKRSRSLVTHVPHYDGHQWRKYGQNNINGRRHPRSYYRCTYREQNCFATKTIQQEQIDGTCSATGGEEIAKYTVVYYGDHTCKDHSVSIVQLPQLVSSMDLQNMEMAQTSSSVQDPEADLDLPALLEVFDNSLIDWEDSWKI
ncbi:probable WRKY transcription factor 53 [Miscanthus floridulus]|uniref:probable WRKY transcription factor 53 n=1 Tax=Miscanthus floridulus TaxID=154761 RepID=UPI003458200F